MIAALLGHRKVTTTSRYDHLPQHAVSDFAFRVAASIAVDILGDCRSDASSPATCP